MNEYLLAFIIGASWPVSLLFFLVATRIKKNYRYDHYTFIAPVYLGAMNMLSLWIAKKFNLSLRMRYIVIGIISPLISLTFGITAKIYDKTPQEWFKYAIMLITKHFVIFNIIVYEIERALSKEENYSQLPISKEENEEIKKMVHLVTNRGILAPNCKYWDKSEKELKDASGVNLYYKLKKKYGDIVPVQMLEEKIYVVTSVDPIRVILDNSPIIFGVGKLKYTIFKSFMKDNVGVSTGCPWVKRRDLNVKVLETDMLHEYSPIFNRYIEEILRTSDLPLTFDTFSDVSKRIVMRVVFNSSIVVPELFEIFSEANSLKAFSDPNFQIEPKTMNVFTNYLKSNISSPKEGCLMSLATTFSGIDSLSSDTDELLQQIPHWIFPTVGLFNSTVPRLLLLLCNHPHIFEKLRNELRRNEGIDNNASSIYESKYLRNCILETLRLNNPVVTTFRTLLSDYRLNGKKYKKGTQFLILNNPVLRDPAFFQSPNRFIPDRWTPGMETSYHAIMFSQGPQRCPGKELAIFLMQSFVYHYLRKLGSRKLTVNKIIDVNNVAQMVNPCSIRFSISAIES